MKEHSCNKLFPRKLIKKMKYLEEFPKASDLTRLNFVSRATSAFYGIKHWLGKRVVTNFENQISQKEKILYTMKKSNGTY
jgi:hypothetical protein